MDSTLTFANKQPQSPDFGLFKILHRRENFIPMMYQHSDGQLRDLCAFPAIGTPEMFTQALDVYSTGVCPTVEGFRDADVYAAINSFYLPYSIPSQCRVTPPWNGGRKGFLPRPSRKPNHLQRINAVYCDFDGYNVGLTCGEIVGRLMDMQDCGKLPQISMIMRSGRGVWAFWRIKDRQQPRVGQRATSVAVEFAKALQRTIQSQLSHLGADPAAKDLARVCRIPGSINSKSGTRAEYWTHTDTHGEIPTYTLDSLSTFFGCVKKPDVKSSQTAMRAMPPQLDPVKGAKARWRKEVERFRKLWNHRGVFKEGVRAAAVYLHLTFLRNHFVPNDELVSEMNKLFECLERADEAQTSTGKSRGYSRRQFERQLATKCEAKPSHSMIANLLRITDEESKLTGWPAFGAVPPLNRRDKALMRRQIIRERFVVAGQPSATCREIADWIASNHPELKCVFRTICSDRKAVLVSVDVNAVQLLG